MKTSPEAAGVGLLPSHRRTPGPPDSRPRMVHIPGRQVPSSDFPVYVVFSEPCQDTFSHYKEGKGSESTVTNTLV